MTNPAWFRPRGYKHLDAPVGLAFASRAERPAFVASHSFLPLLHYTKRVKRYRHFKNKTEFKVRPIMYASHRDACIYSRYSAALTDLLEQRYTETDLSGCVIAYRKLGRANYDFASEVHAFARIAAPCFFLGLDVSDFFGTLDHRLRKARLKRILGCKELPNDWYCIFRQLTRYSWIELSALKENELFAERLAHHSRAPVATINEVLRAGIAIKSNSKQVGIPQGTPISSSLSNLYMIDFDARMHMFCRSISGLYRRYSDDIMIICPVSSANEAEEFVTARIADEHLKINNEKTDRIVFDPEEPQRAQYLGFNLSPLGATIRESSLSRQWRKLRRSLKKIRSAGEAAILKGEADKIYTRSLRRRFAPIPVRNFSSYARRSAEVLDSKTIVHQVRRLERHLERELAEFPKVRTKGSSRGSETAT